MESSSSSLSLYVHIPFCTSKCRYCDFFSLPIEPAHGDTVRAVTEQIIRQADGFMGALGGGPVFETLYIGGGTPSAIPHDALRRLLARFRSSVKGEWTVEANPETIDVEFLSLCSDAGVSRLSVGIQSRTDAHLRLLGRAARAKDIARSITFLEKAWRGDVNLDFITGIPNQVIEDVRDDLSLLDAVGAHHVSLYSLTIEKGTELERLIRCRSVRPNSSDVDELLWFEGLAELERRGFRQYEVSNFSLHGRECQHNLRYWRLDPYLGVGPGAVSTLPSDIVALALDRPDLKDRGVLRLHSPRSITGFISGADRLWGATIEEVDPRSFLLENLMMGLRLEEGIPAPRFFHRFGREFSEFFPGLWERWTTEGLAHRPDGRLRLTLRGRLLLDGLMRKIARRLHSAGFPPIDLRWP